MRAVALKLVFLSASIAIGGCAKMGLGGIDIPFMGPPQIELPASYRGTVPCNHCDGIHYRINLLQDGAFFLRTRYLGVGDARVFDDLGRWSRSDESGQLILEREGDAPLRFDVSDDALTLVTGSGAAIEGSGNRSLTRDDAFDPLEPGSFMRGRYRYLADAGTFIECRTGLRVPVAQEGDNSTLERAYRDTREQVEDRVLASVEGELVHRRAPDSDQRRLTLVVRRFVSVSADDDCSSKPVRVTLEDTTWVLTRLPETVIAAVNTSQPPTLRLDSDAGRAGGFGGCNTFGAQYALSGRGLTLSNLMATKKFCVRSASLEREMFSALTRTQRWDLRGNQLELYDADGEFLARFEARED